MATRMDEIPFSGIREILEECSRLEADGRDVVHLEIGRPDFDTPEPIKRAGKAAIDRGDVHYTSNYGIAELRDAIERKFETDNDIEYDPTDEIVVTSGATEAVFLTIVASVESGDEVLIPDPCWTYEPAIRTAGATPERYRLDPENGFQPDVAAMREAITDATRLLVLNSPQNPTGSVVDEDHLRAIRDLAVEEDLLVLADEIYEKIRYDGRTHWSIGSLDDMRERTITINGFSKAYSMTGWRLGYLAAPRDVVDPIIRLRQYTSTCASSIAQHAGVEALNPERAYHRPLVEAFASRRDLVQNRIEGIPGMECPRPDGGFYAFPTVPDGVADDREFVWSLLREAGVALVPGSDFGPASRGRVRIAYSNSAERINEGFDRIEAWLNG